MAYDLIDDCEKHNWYRGQLSDSARSRISNEFREQGASANVFSKRCMDWVQIQYRMDNRIAELKLQYRSRLAVTERTLQQLGVNSK